TNHAHTTPHHTAASDPTGSWTHHQLQTHANQLAHHLQHHGTTPGDTIAIHLPRSRHFIATTLAILKTGANYLPLDTTYPPARIERLLAAARPRAVVWRSDAFPEPPRVPAGTALVDVARWPEGDDSDPQVPIAPDSPAYVIYTSGSTGEPKGVVVAHSGLQHLVDWHVETYGTGPQDRGSMVASLGFDAAVWELWPYLAAGASVHVCDDETRVDAELLLRWLVAEGVTVTFVPTPLAEVLLSARWPDEAKVRVLLTGGDRLRRFANPAHPYRLVNHYGPTESTVVATAGEVPAEPIPGRQPGIGGPIRNTVCYVVDRSGALVGPGCPGELWIGGAGVAIGYLHDPGLTAERFVPNPFADSPPRLYRTGDLVRWRDDGTLAFLGRIDDQLKIRGHRIEPREVEALLAEHPDVAQAVVTPAGDPPRLVAYGVPAAGRAADRSRQVEHWRTLYEQTYDEDGDGVDPEFDIR